MTEIKPKMTFQHLADTVTILQREDAYVLAQIVGSGGTYYDISRIQTSGNGYETFYPSPNANGLLEGIQGGIKTPKSLEHMQKEFTDMIEKKHNQEASKKEAEEVRQSAFDVRMWKITEAKRIRYEAELKIIDVMSQAKSIEKAIANPVLREAVETAETINKIISYIR